MYGRTGANFYFQQRISKLYRTWQSCKHVQGTIGLLLARHRSFFFLNRFPSDWMNTFHRHQFCPFKFRILFLAKRLDVNNVTFNFSIFLLNSVVRGCRENFSPSLLRWHWCSKQNYKRKLKLPSTETLSQRGGFVSVEWRTSGRRREVSRDYPVPSTSRISLGNGKILFSTSPNRWVTNALCMINNWSAFVWQKEQRIVSGSFVVM